MVDLGLWDSVMPSVFPLMPRALRSIELLGKHGLASSILYSVSIPRADSPDPVASMPNILDIDDLDDNLTTLSGDGSLGNGNGGPGNGNAGPSSVSSGPDDDERDESFPFIEVFRCHSTALTPERLQKMLSVSVRNNRLQVLDIALDTSSFVPATPADRFTPKRDLAFLACDSLHTLGLHEFNFYSETTPHLLSLSRFDGQPFVEWLDLFPNVHTVAVYPGNWPEVAHFMAQLIICPQIKVIHQDVLTGVQWDAARALALKHGVQLYHTPRYVQAEWPAADWK